MLGEAEIKNLFSSLHFSSKAQILLEDDYYEEVLTDDMLVILPVFDVHLNRNWFRHVQGLKDHEARIFKLNLKNMKRASLTHVHLRDRRIDQRTISINGDILCNKFYLIRISNEALTHFPFPPKSPSYSSIPMAYCPQYISVCHSI